MCNREVIVDSCFLNKISNDTKDIDNLRRVLDGAKIIPMVHPYVAEYELALYSEYKKLIDEGYIQIIKYEQMFTKEFIKSMYEGYFDTLYTELRDKLELDQKAKAQKMYDSLEDVDIYNAHKEGSSLADVHMILAAYYMKLPIILTEDSDLSILKDIASRRLKFNGQLLCIYDALDIIKQMAADSSISVTSKELETMLNSMGERSHRAEVKQLWRNSRGIN